MKDAIEALMMARYELKTGNAATMSSTQLAVAWIDQAVAALGHADNAN